MLLRPLVHPTFGSQQFYAPECASFNEADPMACLAPGAIASAAYWKGTLTPNPNPNPNPNPSTNWKVPLTLILTLTRTGNESHTPSATPPSRFILNGVPHLTAAEFCPLKLDSVQPSMVVRREHSPSRKQRGLRLWRWCC